MAQDKQKYNKNKFLASFIILMVVLACISHFAGLSPLNNTDNNKKTNHNTKADEEAELIESELSDNADSVINNSPDNSVSASCCLTNQYGTDSFRNKTASTNLFASNKVWSYPECFPDSNATQLEAAINNGITPVSTRAEIKKDIKRHKLTNITSSPYYYVEELTHSVPYLVPKAQALLNCIGINFIDSLYSKGLDLHIPVVTSVLRTDEDIVGLQKGNKNSITNSCHCYGTTIDITYNRFMPLAGDEPTRYDENLKKTLAEVLFDLRAEGRCYVKYEKKQACFHLTVI